jgi:2-polyprenyl-3-methyl-5-hydroxy-6-metoxy-1,4-benzoquinol methylase
MARDGQLLDAACPVCAAADARLFAHARDVEYYSTDLTYSYLSCRNCGCVYLFEPPVNDLRTIYPANYYSYRSNGSAESPVDRLKRRLDGRLFRRLLAQIPGDRLRVLDVGGGSGQSLSLVRTISDRIVETHEVDLDEAAKAAAEAEGHTFHLGKIEEFASPKPFDLILMLNLIEHVADPAKVLRSMRALLSPGGLLLIKTPNVNTLDCAIFRNHNWGGFHCPRHFVLFNLSSLTRLGKSCGLRVVRSTYTQGAPQWACSILGWLGMKQWITISRDRPLYTHPLYPPLCAAMAAFDFVRAPFMATAQMFVLFGADEANSSASAG